MIMRNKGKVMNEWAKIYKQEIQDEIDPKIGPYRTSKIYNSRRRNQNNLFTPEKTSSTINTTTTNTRSRLKNKRGGVCQSRTQPEFISSSPMFACSPLAEQLNRYKERIEFTIINNNFYKSLIDFANKYLSFAQFVSKNNLNHPKVFKHVSRRVGGVGSTERIKLYNSFLIERGWDDVIAFDFYSRNNHFELWFVYYNSNFNQYFD
jgi:hypothetical protein